MKISVMSHGEMCIGSTQGFINKILTKHALDKKVTLKFKLETKNLTGMFEVLIQSLKGEIKNIKINTNKIKEFDKVLSSVISIESEEIVKLIDFAESKINKIIPLEKLKRDLSLDDIANNFTDDIIITELSQLEGEYDEDYTFNKEFFKRVKEYFKKQSLEEDDSHLINKVRIRSNGIELPLFITITSTETFVGLDNNTRCSITDFIPSSNTTEQMYWSAFIPLVMIRFKNKIDELR